MAKYFTIITLIIGWFTALNVTGAYISIPASPNVYSFHSTGINQSLRIANQDLCISQQHLDSIVEFVKDEVSGEWTQKLSKEVFVYHENHLTQTIHYNWNNAEANWSALWKETIVYNDVNHTQECTRAVMCDGNWTDDQQRKSYFNADNLLTQSIEYEKNASGAWEPLQVWEYSYNTDGTSLMDSLSHWNDDNQKWEVELKVSYEYLNDKIHYIYTDQWNKEQQEWNSYLKTWYLYDNINWDLYGIYTYEYVDGGWEMTKRDGVSYDDNGQYNGYSSLFFNFTQEPPYAYFFEKYAFEDNYVFDNLYLPYDDAFYNEDFFHHMLMTKKLFERNIETYEDKQYAQVQYYYSNTDITTDCKEIISEEATVILSPNPASQFVTINTSGLPQQGSLSIYNRSGIKVLEQTISEGNSISIQNLSSGLYVYTYITTEGTASGRLLIVD